MVTLDGSLDTDAAIQAESQLLDTEPTDITPDCTAMDYITSSGLRLFMQLVKKLRSVGMLNIHTVVWIALYQMFLLSIEDEGVQESMVIVPSALCLHIILLLQILIQLHDFIFAQVIERADRMSPLLILSFYPWHFRPKALLHPF